MLLVVSCITVQARMNKQVRLFRGGMLGKGDGLFFGNFNLLQRFDYYVCNTGIPIII